MAERLETRRARDLLTDPLADPRWIIDGLLPTGLTILAGSPKVGKSWLALDLAIHVANGEPFWGMEAESREVLYLCLEDTFPRVQRRLWRLTDDVSDSLHIAMSACSIPDGLTDQLWEFSDDHMGLGLVIIDTFQMVRRSTRDSAYAADYGDASALKEFADSERIAIVAVHHTRKMGDADAINTVSGTTGITGCADSTMILEKDHREASAGTLRVTGRDVEYQEMKLRFSDCRWELVERTSSEELEERSVPEDVMRVVTFMTGRDDVWIGSARELAFVAGVEGLSDVAFGKHLAQQKAFLAERGIAYSRRHTREGNVLRLERTDEGEGSEGCEGTGGTDEGPVTLFTTFTDETGQGCFFESVEERG